MADLNWFQKLGRARTPVPPSPTIDQQPGPAAPAASSSSASTAVDAGHHKITATSATAGSSGSRAETPTTASSFPARRLPPQLSKKASHMSLRSRKLFSTDPADYEEDEPAVMFIRERDNLCCPPKLEELAGSVQQVLLSRGNMASLPIEYNANVLHIVNGLFKTKRELKKSEDLREEITARHEVDRREWLELADEWMTREQQYKAEVKRLELALSKISPNGVEAVAVARSNSIVDRGGTRRIASRIQKLRESPKRDSVYGKQLATRPTSVKSFSELSEASSKKHHRGSDNDDDGDDDDAL
ncbi:hypothetical protein Micbo1qcDRAFT_202984 [Microdochium bolleyi]|uniref:Uncharacterized protein n=1 Tax=Microdochium bolleyi TaxID=196109 RepID=A0A136J6Q9_9PEZI|nr:hypothetical protein Micbo1qcDRAFT_202984 [Microdochium bolleyi]